jgi:hypothetical protein
MQTLSRILCLLTIFLCLAALDVTAKSSKKSEKAAKSAKQKKDTPAARKGRDRHEKETAAKNSKTDKRGKKGDRQKELAESRRGRDKKDSRNRKGKESIAENKKKSRSEAKAHNRRDKGEREKPSGKNQREVVADNKSKASRTNKVPEPEQTRPRTVKGSRDKEDSPLTSGKERAGLSNPTAAESSHLPKKSLSVSPLPAAQNESVGLMENRTGKGESKLLPPTPMSREATANNLKERNEDAKSAPAPSAKNNASFVTLSKPVEAQPDLHSLSNESSRILPQPQVSVVKPPLVTSPSSTLKAPEGKTAISQTKDDEARLTPGTGQTTKPEQSLSGDDTQSNSSNSRGGITTERVLEIQKALIKRGYLEDEGATGVYDDTTRQAMKRFQMANNLSASGLPSAHALKKLGVSKRPDNGYAVTVKSSPSADRKP